MIDQRLEKQKTFPRAMKSYVMMLYEFVLELKPKKMLEIGVCRGQSTKTILMAMAENRFGELVSVDHKNRTEILDGEYEDLKPYWHFIQGSSHDEKTISDVKNALEDEVAYDLLFIDGDHTYEGAKADFLDYSKMVKPGGIIMMHDVTNNHEGVKDFWAEITWEKWALDWGRAGAGIVPGFGLIRKPKE